MPEFDVTVRATFKKTQAQLNKEAVEEAKAAIEGGSFSVVQTTANTEAEVKEWLINTLNVLFGQSHNIQFRSAEFIVGDVAITSFTPAIAGTETNPEGVNGSFTFTVTLTKGETTITTGDVPGVIIATAYTLIPVKSIELVLLDELTVRVINTGNVATGILTLSLSGADADAFTLPSATMSGLEVGTERNITLTPRSDLAEGAYTVILTISGEELDSQTVEITYEKTYTGANIPQVKPLKAWMQDGILHVSGLTVGKQWRMYNVIGRMVYQNIAENEEATISLTVRGVYIVQSGNRTVKVVY